MTTREQAIKIALEFLNIGITDPEMEIVILEEYIVEKSYGWAFGYNTKKYIRTDDIRDAVFGGSIVVERSSGKLHPLSSAYPLEEEIRRFEQRTGLH